MDNKININSLFSTLLATKKIDLSKLNIVANKFKKTFDFVKMKQFKNASIEMLDSRWNKQTPNRAKHLSDLMATLEV